MLTALKSKSGVTVLEGVIALGLLALVMAGSFGVLLSSSRQTMEPDIYEEMILAVEKANDMLKEYAANYSYDTFLKDKTQKYHLDEFRNGLCPETAFSDLNCLLPAICDLSTSEFRLIPLDDSGSNFSSNWPKSANVKWEGKGNPEMYKYEGYGGFRLLRDSTDFKNGGIPTVGMRYYIKCNGYQL